MTLQVTRKLLLVAFLFGIVGSGAELLLLEHTEDIWQYVPLVLMGVALVTLVWSNATETATGGESNTALKVFRILMALFVLSGAVGVFLHLKGNVEFELEITATAEDLSPELDKALRVQKGRTTMKGFRPGNVPISLVKKVYGKSLAYGVAENAVQKTFEEKVLQDDEYDVLGQPTITDLTYEYEGDLRAVVKFGVRPDVEVKDFGGATPV